MNTFITDKNYRDRHGNVWLVKASKKLPIIKQHMDKIIDVALQAKKRFKRPMAYHLWIRLNDNYSIIKFIDLLKKHYLRSVNSRIEYVRVEEETIRKDNRAYKHHHLMLFVDIDVANPFSLPYFMAKNTRTR